MSRRTTKHNLNQRLEIVNKALSGEPMMGLVKQYQVDRTTIRRWIRNYELDGIEGLKDTHHWHHYSTEFKLRVVEDYLNHQLTVSMCCKKYHISSESVLRLWVSRYTSGKTLSTIGGPTTMKRKSPKKFSYDERLKIVHDTITHDKNYQMEIEKYGVSYTQVYNWVKKYEEHGQAGLEDHRGHRIKDQVNRKLTREEELELELAALKKRNTDLEAENFFLKKLRALKRSEK